MPKTQRTPSTIEHPATGVGQLRHVYKSVVTDEEAAFAHLVGRGVTRPKYKWRAEHTHKAWRWRRVK